MTLTAATIKKLRALNLSDEVFDKVLEIVEEAKAKLPKKGDAADRAQRATRLPPDWKLPMGWGQYALQQGLRESEVRREADNFRDYWLGKAGKDALKLDWEATWRTWARRSAERLGRAPLAPVPTAASAIDISSFTPETWRAVLRSWRRTDQWKPEYGPAPGRPGCKVPADLLASDRKTLFDTSEQSCHI